MNKGRGGFSYIRCGVAGAIGAISMGLLMSVANLLRFSRLNIYRLIGSAVLPPALIKGFLSPLTGFLIHTAAGVIFGLIFARFISRRNDLLSGVMYGYILWLVIMGLVLPFLHIAPAPWELGSGTFATTILGFLGYGGVLGILARKGGLLEGREGDK